MIRRNHILFFVCFLAISNVIGAQSFVQRKGAQLLLANKPYYYIGTNYWYGGMLGLEKNKEKGIERLREELDFLSGKGVTNLRVLVGAEGSGQIHGVKRVSPALQISKGLFAVENLKGLDLLLAEMGKRNMKAILFLSNNWEWSGGFLQYLNWNGKIVDSVLRRHLSWDEMRDYVSKFYSCMPCIEDYKKQVSLVIKRVNTINGKKYTTDPAIMSWELANEPRPMRPAANAAYKQWINNTAAFIKSLDKNHLVTLGIEGDIGTESIALYEQVQADKNVDYLTIHIWPKNWSWFRDTAIQSGLPEVINRTISFIDKHIEAAKKIGKPLVIEEFGLPRDGHSFDIHSTTIARNTYYNTIFSIWKQSASTNGVLAGANFWAFSGKARPIPGQIFWKEGDDFMGDPPMEEQGLNSVFDSDTSTWKIIYNYTSSAMPSSASKDNLPADKEATKETVALYHHLKTLVNKGIMFGHQDDLAYGVNWRYIPGRSDVKDVVGDYPALYGWELGNLEHDLPYNLDSVPFDKMRLYIQQGYERGGVSTLSWHGDNPLNGESAWDTARGGVTVILPGGAQHELYKSWLDKLAVFIKSLKGKNGEAIPILWRPFHELTGNWFWWGKYRCTPAEFKLLWRFSFDYLHNEKGLHNLLYVYNTSDFSTAADFLERYPGDDVVDVLSFDTYQYNDPQKDNSFINNVDKRLTTLEALATNKNKIAAFAETGYEAIPYAEWWTNTLWKAIGQHKISYVLAWRNHGRQLTGHMHYYVPTKNDVSAEDFIRFYKIDKTLFEKEVAKEKLYQ